MTKGTYLSVLVLLSLASWKSFSQSMNSTSEKKSNIQFVSRDIDNKFYNLAADLSAFGEDANILFFDSTCILIGKNGAPYVLNASTEFRPTSLPIALQHKIVNVKSIIISPPHNNLDEASIPEWLESFPGLEYLTLQRLRLDAPFFKEGSSLKHLFLDGISEEAKGILLTYIPDLAHLKYLVHNGSLNSVEIAEIKKKAPALVVLSEREYSTKVEAGEIEQP